MMYSHHFSSLRMISFFLNARLQGQSDKFQYFCQDREGYSWQQTLSANVNELQQLWFTLFSKHAGLRSSMTLLQMSLLSGIQAKKKILPEHKFYSGKKAMTNHLINLKCYAQKRHVALSSYIMSKANLMSQPDVNEIELYNILPDGGTIYHRLK